MFITIYMEFLLQVHSSYKNNCFSVHIPHLVVLHKTLHTEYGYFSDCLCSLHLLFLWTRRTKNWIVNGSILLYQCTMKFFTFYIVYHFSDQHSFFRSRITTYLLDDSHLLLWNFIIHFSEG